MMLLGTGDEVRVAERRGPELYAGRLCSRTACFSPEAPWMGCAADASADEASANAAADAAGGFLVGAAPPPPPPLPSPRIALSNELRGGPVACPGEGVPRRLIPLSTWPVRIPPFFFHGHSLAHGASFFDPVRGGCTSRPWTRRGALCALRGLRFPPMMALWGGVSGVVASAGTRAEVRQGCYAGGEGGGRGCPCRIGWCSCVGGRSAGGGGGERCLHVPGAGVRMWGRCELLGGWRRPI